MKKVISLLIAVIMLMSAIAVSAAPTVDYVFYDEDDQAYYVFGSYHRSWMASTELSPSEVGIYLNNEKYVYEGISTTNELDAPKFGIGFQPKEGYSANFAEHFIGKKVEIQPYAVDVLGEKKGTTVEYDVVNNVVKSPSSNANLKSLHVYRKNAATVYSNMSSEFSPEQTDYTVYGYFGAANSALDNIYFDYITEDPNAVAAPYNNYPEGVSFAGTLSGQITYTIRVTAADKVTTKDYKFTFVNLTNMRTAFVEPSKVTISSKNADPVVVTTSTGNENIYLYPLNRDNDTYFTLTYNITADAVKNAKSFGVSFSGRPYTGAYKNLKIAAREYDNDTLGNIISTFTIPNLDGTFYRHSIDVTSYVTKAIEQGKTSVTIAICVEDFDLPVLKTGAEFLNFQMYKPGQTGYKPVLSYYE